MPKFNSRRLSQGPERFAGRSWEDVAPRLEDLLERIVQQASGGIPPGFNNQSTSAISAGSEESPGTETSGWAAADHTHAIETGSAEDIQLGESAAEGAGSPLARADHTHETVSLLAQVRNLVSLRI